MDGAGLKAWRAERGLTQDELATRIGVTRVTVARWEKGGALSPTVVGQLNGLGVLGDLVCGSGAPPAKKAKPRPKPVVASPAPPAHANCLQLTDAAITVLEAEAKPLGLTWRALVLNIVASAIKAAAERAKPAPGGAVTIPTVREAGMSKLATVRPATKGRRLVGFTSDGKEIWG